MEILRKASGFERFLKSKLNEDEALYIEGPSIQMKECGNSWHSYHLILNRDIIGDYCEVYHDNKLILQCYSGLIPNPNKAAKPVQVTLESRLEKDGNANFYRRSDDYISIPFPNESKEREWAI